MNIEKLTRLPPVELGFLLNPDLPVTSLAIEVSPKELQAREVGCAAVHSHPRGQLIYASSGVIRVICGRAIWVVPPSQAVWVPPLQKHEVYFPGDTALRSLFVDPSAIDGLPPRCAVVQMTPLLRELIMKAVRMGNDYLTDSAGWRLMRVLLDELKEARETPLHLPMAQDERVMRVITTLMAHPDDSRDLEAWGAMAGASGRTLARLFVKETGLTFGVWRKRLHLQEAIDRLDKGQQVTRVAFDLGYQSLSAFIEMFRRELGVSPRRYGQQKESGA